MPFWHVWRNSSGALPWWPSHPFKAFLLPHVRMVWAAPTSFGSIRSLVTRLWNVDLAGSDTVSLDEILRLNACALCVDGGQVAGAVVVHSEDLSTEERDLFGKRSGL